MVSITDYDKAQEDGAAESDRVVRDIATIGQLLTTFDDEPVGDALQRLAVRQVNKLPVVTCENPRKVIGVIRRRDIIKAYNLALVRRMSHPSAPAASMRVQPTDFAELLEIEWPADAPVVGKSLASLQGHFLHDCVIVAVRREGSLLIPHGDTVLQAYDQVTVFLRHNDESKLRWCLLGDVRGEAVLRASD